MRLVSTKHRNFRGLKDDEHTFSETNIIIGDNGAGKTSLIEAIYVSLLGTPLNSFSKANKELSRHEEGVFLSESVILDTKGVNSKQSFESTNKKKTLSSNDTSMTVREAFLSTPICLIDSNIEKIASESPQYRRRLVDRSVFHVEQKHAESYKKLEKALKQRNRSIKNGERKGAIRSWDRIIAEEGETVTSHRAAFVEDLKNEISKIQGHVSKKEITVQFKRGWDGESLLEYLTKNINRDIAAKRTMGGPHRADIYIELDQKPAKEFSSKGEEKQMSLSVALGISKAVETKTGALPILLIDELESGLDEASLLRITDYLKNLKNQQLITALKHHTITKIISCKTIAPKQNIC